MNAFTIALLLYGSTGYAGLPLHRMARTPRAARRVRLSPVMDGLSATQPPQGISADVAINGGDIWSGSRLSANEITELCEEALSRSIARPIMAQFRPERNWLWRQWSGTILKAVLPHEVFFNVAMAIVAVIVFKGGGPWGSQFAVRLSGIERVWTLSSGLVSFTLSFFLNQAYALWRNVYALTRRVQGRLNDICLLAATSAARGTDGSYTPQAQVFLQMTSRYVRVFNILLYASLTTKFAPLATPAGLTALVKADALTEEERELLLQTTTGTIGRGIMGHAAVLGWITVLLERGLRDGTLGIGSNAALRHSFMGKVMDLRAAYGSIADELSGRMPLAYAQLVQILCDMLVLFSPVALVGSVGGWGAVIGTSCMTLFYSSVLKLAKMFLDPLDNEAYGGKYGISIRVETLLHETNIASERWSRGAARVPRGVVNTVTEPAMVAEFEEELEDDDSDDVDGRGHARIAGRDEHMYVAIDDASDYDGVLEHEERKRPFEDGEDEPEVDKDDDLEVVATSQLRRARLTG